MKGDEKVLKRLQGLLILELSAADQYLAHCKQYEDWGLGALSQRFLHESEEETLHAKMIMERMLFLGGQPVMSERAGIQIENDVPSMLKSDLRMEYLVIDELKDVIALCESVQDYVTRQVLLKLLDDSEMDHARWIEAQLWQIEQMSLPNYLQANRSADAP